MERIAIVEDDKIVNVVNAPSDWSDPQGRELVPAPRGSGVEIGAERQPDGSWKKPKESESSAAKRVRAKRDRLLAECDWVVIRARELGQDVPREWFDYRSDLRNVPQQDGFPHDVTWPTKPE